MDKQDIYSVRRKLNMIVQKQNEIKNLVDEITHEINKEDTHDEYNPKIPLIDTPYNTEVNITEYNKLPTRQNTSLDDMSYGNEYDLDSYDNEYYLDSDDDENEQNNGEIYMSPNLANLLNNETDKSNFIITSPIKTEWKAPLKPGLDNSNPLI